MSDAGDDLDERGQFRVVVAVRDALPTRAHAEMLFGQVADLLGDAAWIESFGGGARKTLHRRETRGADAFLPWPLLSLGIDGRLSLVAMVASPAGVPDEPPPRPGRVPRIRGLGPGEILLHDGPHSITVTYGEDGRWFETTRGGPPDTLADAVSALARRTAQPVELLAEFMAALDAARHGPGRLLVPVALPCVSALWSRGLSSIRRALFEERVPWTARWAAADAYCGDALAWGTSREEALRAWRGEVERLRPRLPTPVALPSNLPEKDAIERTADGAGLRVTMRAPASDLPAPEPSVENTPAAVVPLPEPPSRPSPIGAWVRLLDGFGTTFHGALRREGAGFTLLGDRLLDVVELDDLDRLLDLADVEHDERTRGFARSVGMRAYRVVDELTGMAVEPHVVSAAYDSAFDAGGLDGGRVRWFAVRQRS